MKQICTLAAVLCLSLFAADGAVTLVNLDAEKPAFEDHSGGKVSLITEHATVGKKALKFGAGAGVRFTPETGMLGDWSKHDIVKMDIFNPGKVAARLYIQLRDDDNKHGYWSWHNRYVAVLPGQNTIQFPVADTWRGEILRRDAPGMLNPAKMTLFYFQTMDGEIVLGGMQLTKFANPKVDVPGLKAFDVGITGSPGFSGGFLQLNETMMYDKTKGYGWTKAGFINEKNSNVAIRLHPDNLFRDWIACNNAELAVDVPNGKYRVRIQMEDPGAWEFMQNYRKRSVSAEGKVALEETMDAKEFMNRFFRNQDSEDLPTEDPFEKYVETRHPWKEIDVEVADGQLNLGFHSADTYGATLSALVISPLDQEEKTKQFMAYVKEVRRFEWAQQWKSVSKAPTTPVFSGKMAEQAGKDGFALFGNPTLHAIRYDHVPQDAEHFDSLSAAASLGEIETISFGLRPAKALGKVDVSVSALKSAAGDEIGKENIKLRVGRYRFTRHAGEQSGLYEVGERQIREFNTSDKDTLRCDDGMARSLWLTIKTPENAKPGTYTGQITVAAEKGGKRTIPLTYTVLPFTLPEPEHLFGVYGLGTLPLPYWPEIGADIPRKMEIVYKDAREHGLNYVQEFFANIQMQNGKAVVTNMADVERDMALRRKLGFKDAPVFANGGCSLEQLATDAPIAGMPRAKYIEAWHKTITDTFKEKGWPHPAFVYGDEPNLPGLLKQLTDANNAVHAVSPDIWMGIAYHLDKRVKESYEMAATLDVHHLKEFCPVEDFEFAKKSSKFTMHCNVGFGRLPYGLREWRATHEKKTDGCITYAYMGSHVDIYYGLDAREDDWLLAPPRQDGSLTSTDKWEGIREGVDDYRYARALDNLVKSGSASKEQLDAAKALLKQAFDIGGMKNGDATKLAIQWRAEAQKVLAAAAKK
ncbi:MAG TPA: glycoside hydrolase domain-containing protein [Planctomycetota bacterium]|nr:glycoside hydrolase domain-containing protein [Planctomycetota bacterium]